MRALVLAIAEVVLLLVNDSRVDPNHPAIAELEFQLQYWEVD